MKNLKFLSVLVFSILFLASCEKPENEENKPEEPTPEVTTEPRIDLIRKVIRYNTTGGIEDSVLFKYDSQNRVSKVEFGPLTNGRFKNKIDFSYYFSTQRNSNVIIEQDSALNAYGQYYSNSSATYSVNSDFKNAKGINALSPLTFAITYDSDGFIKSVTQGGMKQGSWYMDAFFKSKNNNLASSNTDSDPMGRDSTHFEYYPELYNHDLYFNFTNFGIGTFWNGTLTDLFNFRHSFLGKRNTNLIKEQTTVSYTGDSIENKYEYEFNSSGLVSKIKTATVSSTNGSTPMATRYEIYYY